MQKVFQKQESTEEMFHRRQASLKKLAAKQTRPVQPVAPRPEVLTKSPSPSPGTCSPFLPGSHLRRPNMPSIVTLPPCSLCPSPRSTACRPGLILLCHPFWLIKFPWDPAPLCHMLSALAASMLWPQQSWVLSAESRPPSEPLTPTDTLGKVLSHSFWLSFSLQPLHSLHCCWNCAPGSALEAVTNCGTLSQTL